MATNRIKILLVDDDPDILEFIKYNLEKENYEVLTAINGFDAIELASKEIPDLIVIDVMMPGIDGVETCIKIRENPKLNNILIAFLTARSEDYTQIAGFDAGADDYITKPIKPRVLVSRIKALLRRSVNATDVVNLEQQDIGGIIIDREKYLIYKNGESINLPKKEFELLALLASKPGNVFPRGTILDSVWGGDVIVGDRTIDVHIRKLREKLGDDYIKTIKGVGYKFDF
jgi:two-component system, OmpR family, alkaline phosphatase synthesis response regulator PhoP